MLSDQGRQLRKGLLLLRNGRPFRRPQRNQETVQQTRPARQSGADGVKPSSRGALSANLRCANCTSGDLEIPGSRFASPGMTLRVNPQSPSPKLPVRRFRLSTQAAQSVRKNRRINSAARVFLRCLGVAAPACRSWSPSGSPAIARHYPGDGVRRRPARRARVSSSTELPRTADARH